MLLFASVVDQTRTGGDTWENQSMADDDTDFPHEDQFVRVYNHNCSVGRSDVAICQVDVPDADGPVRDFAMEAMSPIEFLNAMNDAERDGIPPLVMFPVDPEKLCEALPFDSETVRLIKKPPKGHFAAVVLWMEDGRIDCHVQAIRKRRQTEDERRDLMAEGTPTPRLAEGDAVLVRPHAVSRQHLGDGAADSLDGAKGVILNVSRQPGIPAHYSVELTPPLGLLDLPEPCDVIVGLTEMELEPQQASANEPRSPLPLQNVLFWAITKSKALVDHPQLFRGLECEVIPPDD